VVHHVDKPSKVGFEGKMFRQVEGGALGDRTWTYVGKTLQVRVSVKAGEDSRIDIEF
jgi:hypothetical protein